MDKNLNAKPRIFLGLTEVSGYYTQLRRGFQELGVTCEHVPLISHRFSYDSCVKFPWPAAFARFFVAKRVQVPEHQRLLRLLWALPLLFSRAVLFIWAVAKFDVFILGGGSSFFRFAELPLLRLLGRKVIYVLHGTDARPAYIDGTFYEERHAANRYEQIEPPVLDDALVDAYIAATRRRKRDVAMAEKYANAVICIPSYGQLLTRPFIDFLAVGIPFSPKSAAPAMALEQQAGQKIVRVLHAPSDRVVRGTATIRKAIAEVKAKGVPIDYVEISGRPNSEVLEELARCDFVVDAVQGDTPMAGLATEAAFFGKPVIMGGYYSSVLRNYTSEDLIPPTVFCHPDSLADAILDLASDVGKRQRVGSAMQEFVTRRWTPASVAQRYMQVITETIPQDWWCNPERIDYVHGAGLPEDRLRKNIAAVIARGGKSALCLDANPPLRERFATFAAAQEIH